MNELGWSANMPTQNRAQNDRDDKGQKPCNRAQQYHKWHPTRRLCCSICSTTRQFRSSPPSLLEKSGIALCGYPASPPTISTRQEVRIFESTIIIPGVWDVQNKKQLTNIIRVNIPFCFVFSLSQRPIFSFSLFSNSLSECIYERWREKHDRGGKQRWAKRPKDKQKIPLRWSNER